jgi:hypothetical protein
MNHGWSIRCRGSKSISDVSDITIGCLSRSACAPQPTRVMAGLVPAIHAKSTENQRETLGAPSRSSPNDGQPPAQLEEARLDTGVKRIKQLCEKSAGRTTRAQGGRESAQKGGRGTLGRNASRCRQAAPRVSKPPRLEDEDRIAELFSAPIAVCMMCRRRWPG